MHCVFSDNDCLIRIYQSFVAIFPIMLALCLMLSVTYYAQNYAAIIGWSLQVTTKSRTYVVTLDIYLSHSLNLGPIYTGRKGNSNIYLRLN